MNTTPQDLQVVLVRLERYFRRIGWNREAAALLTHLTTHDGGLPQGAPTSPALSNLVNYYLDVQLTRVAEQLERRISGRHPERTRRRVRYSRYADDITFSLSGEGPRKVGKKHGRGRMVRGLVDKTRRTLHAFGYQMHQGGKLRVRRRHQQQLVPGLVVNARPNVPRRTRRKLRAIRHHLATGRPATLTVEQLPRLDRVRVDGGATLWHQTGRLKGPALMSTMTIRKATPEDGDRLGAMGAALARLHHRWDAARFMLPEAVEAGYRAWLVRESQNPDAVVLAAEEGGTVVGYIYARAEERDWNALLDACGYVHDLWVEPTARKRGTGRALMTACLNAFRARGMTQVVLTTATQNAEGQALFRSLGFRPTMAEMTCALD